MKKRSSELAIKRSMVPLREQFQLNDMHDQKPDCKGLKGEEVSAAAAALSRNLAFKKNTNKRQYLEGVRV